MTADGVELRHLRALVAVTEQGSFTDAAIQLGVSQPAVSRTVLALERALGVPLVERTTRSVALTEAGVRCYRAALVALEAVADVATAASGRVRPLRLGYSWSALGRHTTAVLRRWRSEHPDVPIEVHRFDVRDAGLRSRATDVAVVRGDVVDGVDETDRIDAGWRSVPVFREPRVAVLPIGHRLAGRESVRLADLVDDTVLTTAYGTTTLELWPVDARPRASLRVDNTDEWLTEIAGGLAIGVSTESTATQHAHPGVVFVPIADAGLLTVHLVWPARHAHPAAPVFAELVAEVVGDG